MNRRERTWRLAAVELPLLRLGGSILLIIGVYVNNRFLAAGATLRGWMLVAAVVSIYAVVSWALVVFFLRREPSHDLTVATFAGDLIVWTFAIYESGAESSWLFFLPLLRVADQTQTTFRRALAFALFGTMCFAAMLGWVVVVDQRPIAPAEALAKVLFLLLSGIYISLAARTAEARRARLTEAIHVAREASAAKSEFVANMSHEMRTPLQGVIGMLQLAIDDGPPAATVRRLMLARRSAEMLLSLIDDVLDFARIEARKLELQPVWFPIRQMVDDTMKALGVIAAAKQLTLSYIVSNDVPEIVWGDSVRLRQILVNLVGNAVKFTREGEISVNVYRGGDEIRFDVSDTGIGIDPELQKRIFEPFMQADSSHARRHGGAGLGLAIVTRLLEAMNGTVDVKSEPGKGSTFTIGIPIRTDTATPPLSSAFVDADEVPLQAVSSLRILLVEDNEVNREVLTEMLHRLGHSVTTASDGETALAQLLAGRFDAVFMDVQLPGIDGLEVTRRFQESGGTTPIIGLTAHTSRESIDHCLIAGMKAVLTKPVGTAQLAAALRSTTDAADALLEIAGGNPAILDRIRDAFARQTPELLAAIRRGIASGDAAAVARNVHTLKGSLSHFSWSRGAEIAREIESAAHAGDLSRAAMLTPDLEAAVAAVHAALTSNTA